MLKQTLAQADVKNVVIAFHIPLPNHFTKNAVSQEEYAKLQQNYLLCLPHLRLSDDRSGRTLPGVRFACSPVP